MLKFILISRSLSLHPPRHVHIPEALLYTYTYSLSLMITDVDECTEEIADCEDECINTVGSYYCDCSDSNVTTCDGKYHSYY